jgi:gamma-tubulin complex component 5
MMKQMDSAQDIDEMASIHIKFLAKMQERALLADNLKPVKSAVMSLLDLAVLFHDTHMRSTRSKTEEKSSTKRKGRRKSVIPALVENIEEEEEDEENGGSSSETETKKRHSRYHDDPQLGLEKDLQFIDQEFNRLLPFLTAALRNIGRVGAEQVWEGLAERLEVGGRTVYGRRGIESER